MKKKQKAAGPFGDLYRQSACLGPRIATAIYSSAQSAIGEHLNSLLGSHDYLAIASATVNPMDYTSADGFSRDYLCVELMSKYPEWDLGIDRTTVAMEKFWQTEHRLARLSFSANPSLTCGRIRASLRAVEETARRKIAKILGELNLNEVESCFAFGPGASTSLSRKCSDAAYKFGAQNPQLTYNALTLATAARAAYPIWPFTAEVVGGAKLTTVPKNAKTDRVICIEPDLNMFFQKGVGAVIRRRLQRWGLLLNDAQELNALYAWEGSCTGKLATVDLSNASDSIHLELVRLLLPPDWMALIEQVRSPSVVLPSGEFVYLRKVSSMGNGLTFELETLIFYALAQAVIDLFSTDEMDRRCTVFGDDIVIASELVPVFEEVLHFFGFELNKKKTFSEGPFRESCGKHYFSGVDVTPFYIRKPVNTVLRKYWAANQIRRYARLPVWGLDSRYQEAYNLVVDDIPPFFRRFRIPDGKGDGGLVSDWDEATPKRAKKGWEAWIYEDIVPKTKKSKKERLKTHGVLLKSLHKLDLSSSPAIMDSYEEVPLELLKHTSYPFDGPGKQGLVSLDYEEIAWLIEESRKVQDQPNDSDTLPKQQGYKKHIGISWQWPTFGPWM